jgi:4-hydroxy-tetrahydrodipicolinate synthase
VIVYDIPVRTGRKVSTEVLVRLATETSNVVGVKDAAGSPTATARLVAAAPDGYEVYSGDDALTLPLLAVGAVGLIGVATHWVAPDVVAMFDAWGRGDVAEARRINARLLDSWAFETGDDAPNPGPAKAMMRHLGLPGGRCRPPMGSDPDWLPAEAAAVYDRLVAARA